MGEFISRYKYYIGFIGLILAGLAAFLVVSFGYYPALFVNGRMVSERTVMHNYAAATRYYQNLLTTYESLLKNASSVTPSELEAGVLDQLIDEDLIHDGAAKEAGSDLQNLVAQKVNAVAGDPQLAAAADKLYGFTPEEFRNSVLVPQAEEEILSGRLFLRGEKIEDWLAAARKSAHVVLFTRGFSWDGAKVEPISQ